MCVLNDRNFSLELRILRAIVPRYVVDHLSLIGLAGSHTSETSLNVLSFALLQMLQTVSKRFDCLSDLLQLLVHFVVARRLRRWWEADVYVKVQVNLHCVYEDLV